MPILRTYPSLAVPFTMPGLRLWVNAYDIANNGTQQSNLSLVNPWRSKGALLDLNQGTGSAQPTYLTNGINNKPCVRFNGTSNFLISNSSSLAVTSNFTFYCIFRLSSSLNTLQCLLSRGPIGTPYYALMINRVAANGVVDFYDGTNWRASTSSIPTTTNFNVIAVTYDNSIPQMFTYINGSQSAQSGININTPTTSGNFILGGQGATSTSNFFSGDALDYLIYSSTHSLFQVQSVTNFFKNFYGII